MNVRYIEVNALIKELDLIDELSDMPEDWHKGFRASIEIIRLMRNKKGSRNEELHK